MSLFHRVMPIVYKCSTCLHFWNLIQALSLVEKTITKIIFLYGPSWQGKTINVWAYTSKDFIANFKFPAPNSAKMLYQHSVYSEEFSNNDF